MSNGPCRGNATISDGVTAPVTPKAPTAEPEEELPQIDETTIDGYSQEVRRLNLF